MQWEDCVKRGLERVGGERRPTAEDRMSWRMLIENALTEGERGKKIRRKYDSNHDP